MCIHFVNAVCDNIPQVQVDGADIRNKLLGLEVELAEVLDFKGAHLRTHQVLQEVVQHGDDPLSQEGVHKDPLDIWRGNQKKGKQTWMDKDNDSSIHRVTYKNLFCLTWGEKGQCADGFIRHDVVEASQLSKHLQARLLLSSGIGGQAFPLPSIPLQLQNFDFTQVLWEKNYIY